MAEEIETKVCVLKKEVDDKILPSGFKGFKVNGKNLSVKKVKNIMKSVSDEAMLIQKSGYLLKAYVDDDFLYLRLLPNHIEGRKMRHYDMKMEVTGEYVFSGGVNPDMSMSLLCILDREILLKGLTPIQKDKYRKYYIQIARFFIENGFEGSFKLDWATGNVLDELKLFEVNPQNVRELASFLC